MTAADGKERLIDCATAETLLRLIQSILSPKAEPFKLRDHMSEAELIFTALAELSTRQIAETVCATGLPANKKAAKTGGSIAKRARQELESKTGKRVVTGENYLPHAKAKKRINA